MRVDVTVRPIGSQISGNDLEWSYVDENRVGLTLAQVSVGWRVWVKGTLGGDGRIVAALVRVRPE